MDEKNKLGLSLLAGGIVMGIFGDALLRVGPWALNFSLWMTAGAVLALVILQKQDRCSLRKTLPFFGAVVFFAAMMAWRDSPALKALDLLALATVFSLYLLQAQGGPVLRSSITQYAMGAGLAVVHSAFGSIPLLFSDLNWGELRATPRSTKTVAILRGIGLAVPLMILFGALFASADAVFGGFVKAFFHFSLPTVLSHGVIALLFAWVVTGYLRGVSWGDERSALLARRIRPMSLGLIETGIALGLLNLLFLAFVVIQFRYLFGGASLVGAVPGLTYSEYARKGFFELVTASALVLPLLLGAHWVMRDAMASSRRWFRALAGFQIAMVFVIIASAFQRMRLYEREFGLTEQRLYPTAFMMWLAVVFVWFAVTVLRNHRDRFIFGAMVAGLLLVVALNVVNPDALIVRTNAAHAIAGHRLDARYAASLSADAVPALINAWPGLNAADKEIVARRLLDRSSSIQHSDWRVWSLARARAKKLIQQNADLLDPSPLR